MIYESLADGISKFCLQGIFVFIHRVWFIAVGGVLSEVVYGRWRFITVGDVLPGVHTPVYCVSPLRGFSYRISSETKS